MGVARGAKTRGQSTDKLLVTSTLVFSSVPYYLVALLSMLTLTILHRPSSRAVEYYPFLDNPLKWATGLLLVWLVPGHLRLDVLHPLRPGLDGRVTQ